MMSITEVTRYGSSLVLSAIIPSYSSLIRIRSELQNSLVFLFIGGSEILTAWPLDFRVSAAVCTHCRISVWTFEYNGLDDSQ